MHQLLNFLLPSQNESNKTAFVYLLFRVIFAGLLALHGWDKLMNFDTLSAVFPDPLGVGNAASLSLAIFGELVCSAAVIVGLLTRLAVLPMIFTMGVAFFSAHQGSFATGGELAFAYLAAYVLIFIAGAGRFSIDGLIAQRLNR